MSAAAGLRALAEKATPDTVAYQVGYRVDLRGVARSFDVDELRLIALAPELARWAADAAEGIQWWLDRSDMLVDEAIIETRLEADRALLARLASLVGQEGA